MFTETKQRQRLSFAGAMGLLNFSLNLKVRFSQKRANPHSLISTAICNIESHFQILSQSPSF